DCRRALKANGIYISNGGGTPSDNRWGFAVVGSVIRSSALSRLSGQKLNGILAKVNAQDLADLANPVKTRQLKPGINHRYELSKVPEAIRFLETSRARGKVIIEI